LSTRLEGEAKRPQSNSTNLMKRGGRKGRFSYCDIGGGSNSLNFNRIWVRLGKGKGRDGKSDIGEGGRKKRSISTCAGKGGSWGPFCAVIEGGERRGKGNPLSLFSNGDCGGMENKLCFVQCGS